MQYGYIDSYWWQVYTTLCTVLPFVNLGASAFASIPLMYCATSFCGRFCHASIVSFDGVIYDANQSMIKIDIVSTLLTLYPYGKTCSSITWSSSNLSSNVTQTTADLNPALCVNATNAVDSISILVTPASFKRSI